MPKVSRKRQITLPVEDCKAANIEPGDMVETYIFDGNITIVKKFQGAARGFWAT